MFLLPASGKKLLTEDCSHGQALQNHKQFILCKKPHRTEESARCGFCTVNPGEIKYKRLYGKSEEI